MSNFTVPATSEENWISTSDLMAGLMIIFLFIAIAYIKSIGQEESQAADSICNDLEREFENVSWREQIEICPPNEPLVVRFINPEVLFEKGSASLTGQFENMLTEFMPKYMNVVNQHRPDIDKVRIEGHTDDSWADENDAITRFYNNMFLSQSRTYSVLHFSLQIDKVKEDEKWVIAHLESAGRSSSDPIRDEVTGEVDPDRSRRVDFRINLNIRQKRLNLLGGGSLSASEFTEANAS